MDGSAKHGEVSLPWWPAKRERASGREPLSRDEIVATAIRVADAEAPDQLSMRRIGAELGSGATSLYRHVASKDELLDLVVDEVLGEAPLDDDPSRPWTERAASLARGIRDALRRHPGVAPLVITRVTRGPNAFAIADRLLGVLRSAGIDGAELGLAYQVILVWATGYGARDAQVALSEARAHETAEDRQAILDAMFAAVPRDVYPNLLATFDYVTELTADAQFEFGLRALLDGIEAERARGEAPASGDRAAG